MISRTAAGASIFGAFAGPPTHPTVMRILRHVAVASIAALAACGSLKNIATLATALQARYHLPANINVSNRRHLTITFQNVDASMKMDDSSRAAFARDVATFAKTHYPDAADLDDISIAFAAVSRYGPLTTTRTDAPYSFRPDDLH